MFTFKRTNNEQTIKKDDRIILSFRPHIKINVVYMRLSDYLIEKEGFENEHAREKAVEIIIDGID